MSKNRAQLEYDIAGDFMKLGMPHAQALLKARELVNKVRDWVIATLDVRGEKGHV
ncbi:hypothetical protein J2D73_17385 [Acetobacter sacchari]|uniref:Uncharacterized protein n=1 Tax=Acetobacter sacchari TaxID=2661687 RepID=A0ABS3M0C4_9PROT|nr:hypothetical protein [Acetobacter sacchari]MBO1361561.1 hypothetical protein [Acetobacter sacchari]